MLVVHVLFDVDQYGVQHMRASSRAEVVAWLARVRNEGLVVDALRLSGHADRLNGTGDKDYNQKLSQRRVHTVRDLLASQGLQVSETAMAVDAMGDTVSVAACPGPFKSQVEKEECLLPNRRVELQLVGHKAQ